MRSSLLVVAVIVLTIAAAASATQHVGSGTATITGSGTNWNLAITNTGTEAIKCWRYTFPPGIQATAIKTAPAGWQVGGNKPPPAPILGGRSTAGIAPGAKAVFGFTTTRAFDTGRRLTGLGVDPPGITAGSTDCVSDFNIPTDYGSSPPPPKPACRCKSLEIDDIDPDMRPSRIRLEIEWTLKCIPRGEGNCQAMFRIVPPAKKFAFVIRKTTNSCKGDCTKRRKEGESKVSIPYTNASPNPRFAGETFRLKIMKYCRRGLVYHPVGTQTATVVVDEQGRIDYVQSDLDANGEPDGD